MDTQLNPNNLKLRTFDVQEDVQIFGFETNGSPDAG